MKAYPIQETLPSEENVDNMEQQHVNNHVAQQPRFQNHQNGAGAARPPKPRTTSNSSQGGDYRPNNMNYQGNNNYNQGGNPAQYGQGQPQVVSFQTGQVVPQHQQQYQHPAPMANVMMAPHPNAAFVYPNPNFVQNHAPQFAPQFVQAGQPRMPYNQMNQMYQQAGQYPPQQAAQMGTAQPAYTLVTGSLPQQAYHYANHNNGAQQMPNAVNGVANHADSAPQGRLAATAPAFVPREPSDPIRPHQPPGLLFTAEAYQRNLLQHQAGFPPQSMQAPSHPGSVGTPKEAPPQRKKNILVFTNPETNQAVDIPKKEEVEDVKPVESAAEAQSSEARKVSAGQTEAPATVVRPAPASARTSVSEDKPAEGEATVLDARAEFARLVNQKISQPGATSQTTSSRASPAPGATSETTTVVHNGPVGQENARRRSIEITAPPEIKDRAPRSRQISETEKPAEPVRIPETVSAQTKPSETPTVVSDAAEPPGEKASSAVAAAPVASPAPSVPSVSSATPATETVVSDVQESSQDVSDQENVQEDLTNHDDEPEDGGDMEEVHDEKTGGSRREYTRQSLLEIHKVMMEMQKNSPNQFGLDWLANLSLKNQDIIRKEGSQTPQQGRGPQEMRGSYGRQESRGGPRGGPVQQQKVIHLNLATEMEIPTSENAWKGGVKKEKIATDDEESMRKVLLADVRAMLNKLTPSNYEKLSEKMHQMPFFTTPERLIGSVDLIFEKALDEQIFAEMYARLCQKFMSVETKDAEGKPVRMRTVLVQRAQRYFEKTELEESQAKENIENLSKVEMEERRMKARRHYLGNIKFISELHKAEMLPDKVILSCFQRLLPKNPDYSDADDEKLECLCKLLSTCSPKIKADDDQKKVAIFYEQLKKMSEGRLTSSRIRFAMIDAIELRNNNYISRNVNKPQPKTLSEIHKDIRQEEVQKAQEIRNLPAASRLPPQPMQARQNLPPLVQNNRTFGPGMGGAGGMTKNRSVPGNLSSMDQGRPGSSRGGRDGGQDGGSRSTAVGRPSKFLSSIQAGASQPPSLMPNRLGGPGAFSRPNFAGGAGGGRQSMDPVKTASAASSRESSATRAEYAANAGAQRKLSYTPTLQVDSVRSSGANTPTLQSTPQSPVHLADEELVSEEVEMILAKFISRVQNSEGVELQQDTHDATRSIRRWTEKTRVEFVRMFLDRFLNAKEDTRPKTVDFWVAIARENLLSPQVLSDGLKAVVEFTDDIVMDSPQMLNYVARLVGPLLAEGLLPSDVLNEILQSVPDYVDKYRTSFMNWSKTSERLTDERKAELIGKDPGLAEFIGSPSEDPAPEVIGSPSEDPAPEASS